MTSKLLTNIAILDDHQIIIDGLSLLLKTVPGISLKYTCTNGYSLLQYLDDHPGTIDVLIMDMIMPEIDGYEMALILEKEHPEINIIILSMNTDVGVVYNIVEKTDIKAYLPKSANKNILLDAIEAVQKKSIYIHEDILMELKAYKVSVYEKEKLMLSPREVEIVEHICRGLSNKKIAESLYLSEHTVATHRRKIYKKTDCHNAAMLVELAMRLRII